MCGLLGRHGRLSREPAADSKHQIFDLSVKGCVLRYLTAEMPTSGLSEHKSGPDTVEHGRGGERGGGEQLRKPCTVLFTVHWEVCWVKAHRAPVVCCTACCCAEHMRCVECGSLWILFHFGLVWFLVFGHKKCLSKVFIFSLSLCYRYVNIYKYTNIYTYMYV